MISSNDLTRLLPVVLPDIYHQHHQTSLSSHLNHLHTKPSSALMINTTQTSTMNNGNCIDTIATTTSLLATPTTTRKRKLSQPEMLCKQIPSAIKPEPGIFNDFFFFLIGDFAQTTLDRRN